ncbi:armadillo-type protein [Lineolata rhizophorae]|uniref:Armadillo-type protein n=1 Tax=Lineolata rhizophorae TaxID=578093 RepID=A0A6A6NPT8_9PEZI|nr:armadillo-type protein [Lineolata rhizophorae]
MAPDEAEFVELLKSLLLPDTERVKAATSTLKKQYYTSPISLVALLRILAQSPDKNLRQLAAVEARKLVSKHWKHIPADQKPHLRNQLLQATLNEEATLVRHNSARVITAIAKIDLEDGEWADLPSVLQQAATSNSAQHREVGVFIIYTLIEAMGDMFSDNLDNLFALFAKTIQDPDSMQVRTSTMLALSRVAMLLDTEEDGASLRKFQDAVPQMVAVLKATVEANDEDQAMPAFEVFQTLLGCDTALLARHFGDLVRFMLELASETSVDDDFRSQALAFLMQSVRYRRLKLQALRIGEEITVKALQIVTELGDLTSDDDEITPARSALGLLDILASSLPPSQVVVPLLKAIGPYVTNQDPEYRRASILALGMCVEGAPDFIATQLKEILPMVLHLLEDPNVRVRAAALNGVARLADDLAEDMGKEHARLIPAMVKNFDTALASLGSGTSDEDERKIEIVRGSCNAIDSLIEGLDKEDAAKYAPELVPRFSRLFEHPDFKTRVASVGAVGSIAAATEDAFLPYFENTMRVLGQYVPRKDSQEDLDLRGVVCDSMGKIAAAVGAEAFSPYVRPLMEASEEALHLDHPRLRETSYVLWSTVAKVYGEEFAPYLDGVVRGLDECLKQEETDFEVQLGEDAKELLGQEVMVAGRKIKVAAGDAGDNGDDEDEAVIEAGDEDDDAWSELGGVTAVAMEKEIAVEVVGDVLSMTRAKFMPYVQKTVETVLRLVTHSYEGVRKAALGTLWRTYETMWGLAEEQGMEKWKPGLPLQVQPGPELTQLGEMVMQATLGVWEDEMDRGTVTDINRDIATILKSCGPAILLAGSGNAVTQISSLLIATITKRHPCQQDLGDEADDELGAGATGGGEDPLDESSEYDWLVIETALDAVASLSFALGPSFAELWKALEKPALRHCSSTDANERSAAVGTVAECVGAMGEAVAPFSGQLFKALTHRLADEDPDTKANAAYGVGLLVEYGAEPEVVKNLGTVMVRVEPLLDPSLPLARLVDNAAGCVARVVRRMGRSGKVPLGEVLPRLVECLPIREDFEENAVVWQTVVGLYEAGEPAMRELTPAVVPAVEKVLGPPEEQLDEVTRARVAELVEYFKRMG